MSFDPRTLAPLTGDEIKIIQSRNPGNPDIDPLLEHIEGLTARLRHSPGRTERRALGRFGDPPTGYSWKGDFHLDAQNFSEFDTHDANLGSSVSDPDFGTTVGSVIVPKPAPFYSASAYSCRCVASDDFPSSSSAGAATVLWQPGDYGNSWAQTGATSWFRMVFLLPNGTNPTYPGHFNPQAPDGLGSTWRILMEWHIADGELAAHGGSTAPSSTIIGIAGSSHGGPCLLLRPVGGPYGQNHIYYIKETNATQTKVNSGDGNEFGGIQPLQYNHWYDILVYQEFNVSDSVGYLEWWVDGNKRFADNVATLVGAQDGFVPGVGYEGGLYRSFTSGEANETIYIASMVSGTTAASVGGGDSGVTDSGGGGGGTGGGGGGGGGGGSAGVDTETHYIVELIQGN